MALVAQANLAVGRDYGANQGTEKLTVFFWVDLLGTLSLMPDAVQLLSGDKTGNMWGLPIALARAARAARLGGRVTQIIRRCRGDNVSAGGDTAEEVIDSQAGAIGAHVTEMMAKNVVMLVLAIIMIVPPLTFQPIDQRHATTLQYLEDHIFSPTNTYPQQDKDHVVHALLGRDALLHSLKLWEDGVPNSPEEDAVELVFLRIRNETIRAQFVPERTGAVARDMTFDEFKTRPDGLPAYRSREVTIFTSDTGQSHVVVDTKFGQDYGAVLGIFESLTIVGFFTFCAVVFRMVVEDCVVVPIEKISNLIKRLSTTLSCLTGADAGGTTDEMEYIKVAFRKMGGLLTMVYGEAGASTIAQNITGNSADLNPFVAGRKADFIFGFCDIREFTAATECLQEDVMLFVNGVGQIVHDIVVGNGGYGKLTWLFYRCDFPTAVCFAVPACD